MSSRALKYASCLTRFHELPPLPFLNLNFQKCLVSLKFKEFESAEDVQAIASRSFMEI